MENEIIEQPNENWKTEIEEVYTAFKEQQDVLSSTNTEKLNALLQDREVEVSIVEYIYIMYMKGKTYESEDNRNGARYTAMRMLWMKECYEKPRKKRPRYLDMQAYTFDEETLLFINKYTDFLEDTYRTINRKLLIISGILMLAVVAFLFFLLNIQILVAIVEGFGLCALNYWLQKRRLPDMFQKNQTNVIEKYIDEALLDFDRMYRVI